MGNLDATRLLLSVRLLASMLFHVRQVPSGGR